MADIRTTTLGGIPFGINSQRPTNPQPGQPFFNGQENRLEVYTQSVGWQNIVGETPGVISVGGEYLESNATNTISISGTNFVSGALAYAIGTNGVEVPANATAVISIVEISATFSGLSSDYEPYDIKVVNPSNLYGLLNDVLYVNSSPVWTTAAGSLGTFDEKTTQSIQLATTDSEGTARTYSITSGGLPAGLTMTSGGLISGTLTEVSATTTSNFTVTATDSKNPVPRAFSITTTNLPPVWVTASGNLATFTRNVSYSATVQASDAHAITYSISSGSLPTGMTINSTTGVISGTPSNGIAQTFTVRATNAGGEYADRSFTIPNVGPSWSTASPLPTFTRNSAYSTTVVATDDSGVTPTYSILSGSLPTGLTLNSTTGVISGTPTSSTTATFTLRAADANGTTADRSFTMPNVGPVWSTTTLPSGSAGVAYSQQVTATDDSGVAPTYSLISGSLPTGLTISSSGLISGTPSSFGSSTFTLRATDANGTTADQSLTLTVSSGIVATGGTVVTSGGYKYHTFTGSGTFTVTSSPVSNAFEVLVVAGGGGGGNDVGGGGGAGGAIYKGPYTIPNGSYTVTIGAGSGRRASGDTGNGASNSSFGALTAFRGGGGTSWPNIAGLTGGCGGGGAGYPFDNTGKASTQTSNDGGVGYGSAGGNGISDPVFAGGGGGGAGGVGQNGSTTPSPGKCGDGGVGIGLFSTWASATGTGSSGYYAGGGGGSSDNGVATRGSGGLGGGGRGMFGNEANLAAGDGVANTGGGGGGSDTYPGGAGGSGICIVRYVA